MKKKFVAMLFATVMMICSGLVAFGAEPTPDGIHFQEFMLEVYTMDEDGVIHRSYMEGIIDCPTDVFSTDMIMIDGSTDDPQLFRIEEQKKAVLEQYSLFNPAKEIWNLIKKGAKVDANISKNLDGKYQMNFKVYLEAEQKTETTGFDGCALPDACKYTIEKGGIEYGVSPIQIEWSLTLPTINF